MRKREARVLLGTLLVAVTVGGGLGLFAWLRWRASAEVLKKSRFLEPTASVLAQQKARIPQVLTDLAEVEKAVGVFAAILPDDREARHEQIQSQVSRFEAGSRLDPEDPESGARVLEFGEAEEKGGRAASVEGDAASSFRRYSYKLRLRGRFFAFVRFLNLIENHERFIKVDAFDIRPTASAGPRQGDPVDPTRGPECEFNVTLSTYTYVGGGL